MNWSFLALAMLATVATSAHAQEFIGDWQGTLKVGPGELRLIVHIKTSGAGFAGSMDSIDQGANGIPIPSISVTGAQIKFDVPAVHGSYEGKMLADGNTIEGTWTQGSPLPLNLTRTKAAAPPKPAKPSDIDGAWSGNLVAAGLRLIVHITNTDQGLRATMDSPDQVVNNVPATSVTRDGNSLTIEWKQIGGKFTGTVNAARTEMEGTWSQGGQSLALHLSRGEGKSEPVRRPQDPVKPYPYREEDVSYENKAAGITLAGTLTIPPGKGPFPAVFLITGSGPQDRNEALAGHRPFLVLADALTRKGIAVLRADDRGVGKSTGDFSQATTVDFAGDAFAAVRYLQSRPEVDANKIGLIGHSEGGLIAPMVAVQHPADIAFIVLMAGPGVDGEHILIAQTGAIAKASGASLQEAEKRSTLEQQILEVVERTSDPTQLAGKLKPILESTPQAGSIDVIVKQVSSPWFRYFLTHDPAPTLSKVRCPVLALIGSKDVQVPPLQNVPALRKALKDGGNRDFEVDELSGLNHLFQTATTGAPSEYGRIEETISPVALDKISSWILRHVMEPIK